MSAPKGLGTAERRAYLTGAPKPAYFILLERAAGSVTAIRDFRYVPYIAAEAELEILD